MNRNKKIEVEPGYNKVTIDEEMMAIRKSTIKEMVETISLQQARIFTLEKRLRELEYGE